MWQFSLTKDGLQQVAPHPLSLSPTLNHSRKVSPVLPLPRPGQLAQDMASRLLRVPLRYLSRLSNSRVLSRLIDGFGSTLAKLTVNSFMSHNYRQAQFGTRQPRSLTSYHGLRCLRYLLDLPAFTRHLYHIPGTIRRSSCKSHRPCGGRLIPIKFTGISRLLYRIRQYRRLSSCRLSRLGALPMQTLPERIRLSTTWHLPYSPQTQTGQTWARQTRMLVGLLLMSILPAGGYRCITLCPIYGGIRKPGRMWRSRTGSVTRYERT
jgi:hypothetical protein